MMTRIGTGPSRGSGRMGWKSATAGRTHFILAACAVAWGCGAGEGGAPGEAVGVAPQVASSPSGMVVAAQPLAAEAGARMLDAGGNAADAAVAAAFAVSVVEPSMNSIGGRTQILVRLPDGIFAGIDATTQAPATYDPETAPQASYGYPTVGVPGAVAGLARLLREHGTMSLEEVLAPAIALAEDGFALLPGEAARHAAGAGQLFEFEGSRAHFLTEDGSARPAGTVFVQPDLAATLRAIAAAGEDVFYRGEIAGRIAADMEVNGGAVTAESLAAYEALDARIVRGSYRGHELVGTDIPASGAVSIGILHILEHFDMASLEDDSWAALVGTAIARAFEERTVARGGGLGDLSFMTDKEWAADVAAGIDVPGATRQTTVSAVGALAARGQNPRGIRAAMHPRWTAPPTRSHCSVCFTNCRVLFTSHVLKAPLFVAFRTNSPAIRLSRRLANPAPRRSRCSRGFIHGLLADWDASGWGPVQSHTTHLSAADGAGMYVALTQTIGPNLGSRVMTPGLGFLHAATLGGYLGYMEPGERARSSISPLMVLQDGEPVLVLGAAGGARIISAVVQAVVRVVDQGMSLPDALAAARVHPIEGGIQMETSPGIGWAAEDIAEVVSWGMVVQEVERAGAFGRIHGIWVNPGTGEMVGVADPDWEGAAIVPGARGN